MSEELTLMQIFQLLKDHFEDYANISDTQTDKFIQRRKKGVRESRNLKCNSCPTCSKFFQFMDRATSPIIFTNGKGDTFSQISCNDVKSTSNVPVFLDFQDKIDKDDSLMLSLILENADMKTKLQEINQHLKGISKSIEDNEEGNFALNRIDRILSKVIRTHKRSEILCDKLCEGLENVESTKSLNTLPSELKDFCNRIKQSVGQEYRQLGSLLGLEPDFLKRIEEDYSEADECLEPIILEWCRREENPSLDQLVTACHTVNPDILKYSVTVLSLNADPIGDMECREEKPEPFKPVSMLNPLFGRRHNSFSNELEFDDGRSCISEISFASGSSNLEPQAILAQIAELLLKAGLKLSK